MNLLSLARTGGEECSPPWPTLSGTSCTLAGGKAPEKSKPSVVLCLQTVNMLLSANMAHISHEMDGFFLMSFSAGIWETLGFYFTMEAAQDRIEKQFHADTVAPSTIVGITSGPVERILLLVPVKGARVYSTHNQV